MAQALKHGVSDVDFVSGAEALTNQVFNTGETDDRSDNAAGDNTGTWGGGLHEHVSASDLGFGFVADGFAIHGESNHVFLSLCGGFLNGGGNVVAFGDGDADFVLVVANGDEGFETHTATTSDGAGDAINVNRGLVKFFRGVADTTVAVATTTAIHAVTGDVASLLSRGGAVAHLERAGHVDDFGFFVIRFGHN